MVTKRYIHDNISKEQWETLVKSYKRDVGCKQPRTPNKGKYSNGITCFNEIDLSALPAEMMGRIIERYGDYDGMYPYRDSFRRVPFIWWFNGVFLPEWKRHEPELFKYLDGGDKW